MTRRSALFLMDHGGYQEQLREDYLATARHHGFQTRVFSADNDVQKQLQQIRVCLSEPVSVRPTLVLISPVQESDLRPLAEIATGLGIGWVLLNRWSESLVDLHRQFSHLPVFCISVDQYEVGRIQGRQFKALLPGGGELLYIRGPVGTSSAMRRLLGVHEVLADTSVRIFTERADWSTAGGERVMREWLPVLRERTNLNSFVVGAQNDSMGIGARRELAEEFAGQLGLRAEQVRFTGCDGGPNDGMRWTSEGKLAATVIIPPVAGRALGEVAAMLSGGPRPAPEILLDPSSFPDLRVVQRRGARSATPIPHR